jgi:hypothetical protein
MTKQRLETGPFGNAKDLQRDLSFRRVNWLQNPQDMTTTIFNGTELNFSFLDFLYPGFTDGKYLPEVDIPGQPVGDWIRFFGRDEATLGFHTRAIARAIFRDEPQRGESIAGFLDFLKARSAGKLRRTGESVVCHLERTLVRTYAGYYLSRFEHLQALDEPKQDNILLYSLLQVNSLHAAGISSAGHDFKEDFGPDRYKSSVKLLGQIFPESGLSEAEPEDHKKYYSVARRDNVLVFHNGKDNFEVEFADELTAQTAHEMMEAYSKTEYPRNVLNEFESTQEQLLHLIETYSRFMREHGGNTHEIVRFLFMLIKNKDRSDNVATYWNDGSKKSKAKLVAKLHETIELMSAPDLSVWARTYQPHSEKKSPVIFPPETTALSLLRLLGGTLDELFTPALERTTQFIGDHKAEIGKDYLVVPDVYRPIIITTDGRFFVVPFQDR